jgi:CRP-like cAMP-binding protein
MYRFMRPRIALQFPCAIVEIHRHFLYGCNFYWSVVGLMFKFSRRVESSQSAHWLAGVFIFSSLTTSQLKIVEDFMHDRTYLSGEVVFDAGEEGQALYIIVSGKVLICHPGQFDQPIAVLGPGHFFGELALLDKSPRSAQARVSENAEICVLFRGDFERLMESHVHIASRIAMQLARHMGQRLRRMVAGTSQ